MGSVRIPIISGGNIVMFEPALKLIEDMFPVANHSQYVLNTGGLSTTEDRYYWIEPTGISNTNPPKIATAKCNKEEFVGNALTFISSATFYSNPGTFYGANAYNSGGTTFGRAIAPNNPENTWNHIRQAYFVPHSYEPTNTWQKFKLLSTSTQRLIPNATYTFDFYW